MTPKTTITCRVTPDTRQTLDLLASNGHTTTSELAGRVLTEWVAAQAAPIEQQGWYRAGALVAKAQSRLALGAKDVYNDTTIGHLFVALSMALDAIDVLAGTAPEEG